MTVLVTGGAGYIGSHVVLALADAGERAIVLDDLSTGFAASVAGTAELVVGDAGDKTLVRELIAKHGIDRIVHLAAKLNIAESMADPDGYFRANAGKTRSLLEAAAEGGVRRFVFSSTCAVYGIPDRTPIDEDTALRPISPYGESKLMCERMLSEAATTHGMIVASLRFFNVAGADPAGRAGESTKNTTHLVKIACQAALGKREALTIYGNDYPTADGTCIRDYIHVSDLAAAHLAVLDGMGGGYRALNCGYGHGYSVREVIAKVKQVSGVDFAVREGPRRAGDPPALVAQADRIRQEFGWRPRHDSLDAIVRSALAWEKTIDGI